MGASIDAEAPPGFPSPLIRKVEDGRPVAGTLERRWNDALLQLDGLKKQAAEFRRHEAGLATPEQKAKVVALARDLPRL